MSSQRECWVVEIEPGAWFYIIEDASAPKDAWDWMDYAKAYGPFPTAEQAHDHQYATHGSISGCTEYVHGDMPEREKTQTLLKLIREAQNPMVLKRAR